MAMPSLPDDATMAEHTEPAEIRHDWTLPEANALFALPFNDLIYRAHTLFRKHFDPNRVQLATLLNIKTGGCPEDCRYCAQSVRYQTGVKAAKMLDQDQVLAEAAKAKASGAGRFCMGAAWRAPNERDLDKVCGMIAEVKAMGLETCVTLGMLSAGQAKKLKEAGLDFYNHNLDTSEEYYAQIITTRSFNDRLETLRHVREAGLKICAGGILGLGEGVEDRASLLTTLANLPEHPESVPINTLVRIPGTPLGQMPKFDPLDLVRTIAVARIMMPASVVRLAAGRLDLDEGAQALCFFAGANSIFYGERLLTTPNAARDADRTLLDRLGIQPLPPEA
jgi:biotin synthase